MKLLRLLSVFILLVFCSNAQVLPFTPAVDQRTELLGVVFRLAGANEFINNNIEEYSKAIDDYFSLYSNHDAVKMAKLLRSNCGISYDAVISLAVNIEIANNQVKLVDNIAPSSLDSRWLLSDAKRFVQQLNRFYAQTSFKDFYNGNKRFYANATHNFMHLLQNLDIDWFSHFFGVKSTESFDIIIGLTHTGSFGVQRVEKHGHRNIYAVIGTFQTDSMQIPIYKPNMLGVIVHEFCHSFCNVLVDGCYKQMERKSKEFFKIEKDILRQNAYTTAQVMLYETLVRACVIRYYMNKNASTDRVRQLIAEERNGGFIWIEDLVQQLDMYENNRDKYRTLADFMPQLVAQFNSLDAQAIKTNIVNNSTSIVSCSINNGDKKVNPSTQQIVVTFATPMNTRVFGVGTNPRGKGILPRSTGQKVHWNKENETELIIPVKLAPDTRYSMVFYGRMFMDKNGFPLKKDFILSFKTSK